MKQKMIYWYVFSPLMKKSIKRRYDRKTAKEAIHDGKKEYKDLVKDAPELGKGNRMASNAYFAYAFVGAYLGSKKTISPEDMALIMGDVLKTMKPFFGFINLNKRPKYWYKSMKKYEKWCKKGNNNKYPSTWEINFDEKKHKNGSYFYFTSCPICSYLNKRGIGEIMKPLCETDKIMYAYQHGTLHREHTIASGSEICDYWVYGDKVKDPE